MDLAGVREESRRYGPIAYVGTSGPDGEPYVAPVAVAWVGEPGGPESDNHVFVRITPTRATVLRMYGINGRDTWRA